MTFSVFLVKPNLHVLNIKEKDKLKKIGNLMRKERIKNNLTQAQMAHELGTSTKQYQRIEYGEVNTRVLNIFKIADILNISPEKLIK
jgi:transcriptional regulator with XRE-family HTH domain